MKIAITTVLIIGLFAICDGQSDGRYQPVTTPRYTTYRPFSTTRRYSPSTRRYSSGYSGENAGRSSDNPGRYRGKNDGRYVPNPNDGKYVHQDVPYRHLNAGGGDYRGSSGRYVPDPNAGKYIHDDDPYKHQAVGGGDYSGSSDRGGYKGDKDKQYPYKYKQYGGGGGGGSGGGGGDGRYKNSGSGLGRGHGASSGTGNQAGATGGLNAAGTGGNAASAGNAGSASSAGSENAGGAYGGATGSRRPYGGSANTDKTKGYYDRFDKEYDIIHLARKGYKDGYFYTYETANGILAEETSQDVVANKEGTSKSEKAGWYEYTGPDGKLYHVDYTAGENGFVPKADFIPTIPPLIQKALDWLKQQEDKTKSASN